jgi:diguanylate cyclase (GGDEF)-like protein
MVRLLRALRSLTSAIRAFVCCVCLVIVALCAITTYHARDIAVGVAQRETLNLAESIDQQAADTLDTADAIVHDVVERVELGGSNLAARRRMQDIVAHTIGAMPRLHDLVIVDAGGRVVLDNTSLSERADLDYRNREAYKFHRAHASDVVYISVPAPTGSLDRWDIEVSRRIDGRGGRFAGIVLAQIELSYDQIYAGVDLGASGIVYLARDDGTIVVQRPAIDLSAPESIAGSAIFRSPLSGKLAGSILEPSPVDGVRRMYSFRRLDRYPLMVVVGLAESEFLASWAAYAWANLIAAAVVVALISGLGIVLTIQMERRNQAEKELARLALVDGLTSIANRRQLDEALGREWQTALRNRSPLALLMIDADHFKHYNDRYGHLCGDEVLRMIATTVAERVRACDLAARYGGEEFAVILPDADVQSALAVAERIRGAIAGAEQEHIGTAAGIVTVSVGVYSLCPAQGGDVTALIAGADRALYAAKDLGRNRSTTEPAEAMCVEHL